MLLPGLFRELSGLAGLLPGMKMHKEDEQLGEVISDWVLPAATAAAAAFNEPDRILWLLYSLLLL